MHLIIYGRLDLYLNSRGKVNADKKKNLKINERRKLKLIFLASVHKQRNIQRSF